METTLTKSEIIFRKAIEACSNFSVFNKSVNELNKGMGKALCYLEQKKDSDVTASELSEHLCVSQARVTKIVNKLESVGLVLKEVSKTDARSIIIKNTKEGSKKVHWIYGEIIHYFDYLIDKIGEEDLLLLLSLLKKVNAVTNEYNNTDK